MASLVVFHAPVTLNLFGAAVVALVGVFLAPVTDKPTGPTVMVLALGISFATLVIAWTARAYRETLVSTVYLNMV